MLKSQERLLTKLQKIVDDDTLELTAEEQEDYDELTQLLDNEEAETEEEKAEEPIKNDNPLKDINNKLEEIKKCLIKQSPQEMTTHEIPAPAPAKPNQSASQEEVQELPMQENKFKAILKKLW